MNSKIPTWISSEIIWKVTEDRRPSDQSRHWARPRTPFSEETIQLDLPGLRRRLVRTICWSSASAIRRIPPGRMRATNWRSIRSHSPLRPATGWRWIPPRCRRLAMWKKTSREIKMEGRHGGRPELFHHNGQRDRCDCPITPWMGETILEKRPGPELLESTDL